MHAFASLLALACCASTLPAQLGSLTTTFVDNNGRSTAGAVVMMDVNVTNPAGLRFVAADLNLIATVGASFTVEVYTTPVTYQGSQTNPAAWTLVSEGRGTAQARGTPSPVDLRDFVLAPGTYGLAFSYQNSGVAYTNGTGANQTYANSDLTLNLGFATSAFFSGTQFNPRVWNGTLYYYAGNACYGVFRQGCAHATATPRLQPAPGSVPRIGSTFTIDLLDLDASGAPALMALGFDNTNTPFGPAPLPMGPLGAPGCQLLIDPLAFTTVANTAGRGAWSLVIPNNALFRGTQIVNQAMVLAPGVNALNGVVTNGGEGVVAN